MRTSIWMKVWILTEDGAEDEAAVEAEETEEPVEV